MSFVHHLTTLLEERGPSLPDDIHPLCPGKTKKQLVDGLRNACVAGKVHVHAWTSKVGTKGRQAIWAAGPAPEPLMFEPSNIPRGEYAWIGPVSSVWALGAMQ